MARGQQAVEAMNDMVKSLVRTLEQHNELCEGLVSNYETVFVEWNDEKCEELGNVIRDIVTKMRAPYADIHECMTRIQLLRGALEDYLNTHVSD